MIRKKQNARALVRCTESSVSVENGEGEQQARCTYQAKDTFEKPRADSKMPRMECPSSVLWIWMNW
eukprot:scaffold5971_cov76-Alexandrium_tamarense.AAC.1